MLKNILNAASLLSLALVSFAAAAEDGNWEAVSGTAIHYESELLQHSEESTPKGVIRRSTDIVELSGDLEGRALFQAVSVFDRVAGTLVNTGSQVFSGTVLGSDPVMLHDDQFRFDVSLATGATTGNIYLTGRVSGPNIRCILQMEGTGRTPEGNNLANYWGRCKVK